VIDDNKRVSVLPERPVERFTRPLVHFIHVQSASGVVLLVCTAVALGFANSELNDWYSRQWEHVFRIGVGSIELSYPLWYWVNDALMTIFFFVIGLEIKRELVTGELTEIRKAVLPVAAAAGGAVVPALIYVALSSGGPSARGWAVPMATDIAFVVGCLALLGPRVPKGLKIMMLSLAIVDDILAVLVIALFYTGTLKLLGIAGAIVGLMAIAASNRLGVHSVAVYLVLGIFTWLCTLKSGVHPTVAGVAVGLLTPANPWIDTDSLLNICSRSGEVLRKGGEEDRRYTRRDALSELAIATREASSPLERLELSLHPWVGFVIMPLFALANAAVVLHPAAVVESTAMAIALALVIGKPAGVIGASYVSVKLGWARLPAGVDWRVLSGAGCLAGIGFTMSLFIASLGLDGAHLQAAKTGVMTGSMVSAALGMSLLWLALRRRKSLA
jgi:NhaA family Na+:H+ antiporter